MSKRFGGRFWVILLALTLVPPAVLAGCKESLPSADLRSLDARVDTDPVRAVADARALLQSPSIDASRRGQLYAVIADAYDTLEDQVEGAKAIAAGREVLHALPSGPEVDRLQLRFALVEADSAQNRQAIEAALRALNDWERRLPALSLGRACLLLVRSRVEGRVAMREQAADDGLRAHALAVALKAGDARAEAAFQLATTFRRAGLNAQAVEFANEAIDYARATRQQAALSGYLFVKAQILDDAGQPQLGLPVIRESRQISLDLKDDIVLAFANHELCFALHQLRQLDAAQAACLDAQKGFRLAGRDDQLAGTETRLAQLDAEFGRFAAALARLDKLLVNDGRDLPPLYLPTIYRLHSEMLSRFGRTEDALRSLRKSAQLTEESNALRQSLAVALLGAQQKIRRYERDQQNLNRQLDVERQQARNRELSRRLAYGLAIGSALLAALFAFLLTSSRRYSRELRRQDAILRTTSENSPDALVLLDARGRIRFASRALLGQGGRPERGTMLADSCPPDARASVSAAVTELVEKRLPVERDIQLASPQGEQFFELRGLPIVEHDELLGATLRASDVTERRLIERKLLDVVSRERQRASSDLHEGLGQELTGVALQLRAAATEFRSGKPVVVEQVDVAIAQIDHAIAKTRDLAHGLSPMQTERGSLPVALERLAADATARLRVPVRCVSASDDLAVPDDVADHLYRIAHEAVANAARHSGCKQIVIELQVGPTDLVLRISDDGAGLVPGYERMDRWGLRMMSYRARLLGGALRLESEPAAGTRVIVTVPRDGRGLG